MVRETIQKRKGVIEWQSLLILKDSFRLKNFRGGESYKSKEGS
jgi:hypothetical protein